LIGAFAIAAALAILIGGTGCYMLGRFDSVLISVTAIVAVIIVALGVWVARSITEPMAPVVRMAEEIGRRHLGIRLQMDRQDEIGVMIKAMNQLAEDLQKNVIAPLNKIAAGDWNMQIEPRDSQDEMAFALKKTVDSLGRLVNETNALAQSAREGKLTARGSTEKLHGGYQTILRQFNNALDAFTSPIKIAARYVSRIAQGDLPPKITDAYSASELSALRDGLNVLIDVLDALADDTAALSRAAAEGRLAARADANKYTGHFRQIILNVNNMLAAVEAPLKTTADYVGRLAMGEIPPKIVDPYVGDLDVVRRNLNEMIETARMYQADSQSLVEAARQGRWSARADISQYAGSSGRLIENMNQMMEAMTQPLSVVAERLAQFARGDVLLPITDRYKGDWEKLKNDLNMCLGAMNALTTDMIALSQSVTQGKLTARADISRRQGDFRKIAQSVNEILDSVTGPLRLTAEYTGRIANGELPPRLRDGYQGDWAVIKDNLNACIDAIHFLISDVDMLTQAMADGRLGVRADVSRHQGRFQQVVQGANSALQTVMESVSDAGRVLTQLAHGDLAAKMDRDGKGDLALLKNSVDSIADGLRNMAVQTQRASFGMTAATAQILASSSQMANVARKQANAVIQVTNAVQETRTSTSQSVQQAQEMAQVIGELASVVQASAQAARHIVTGVEHENACLDQLAEGMNDINQAVQQTLETAQQWQELAHNLMALSEQLKLTASHYRL